MKKTATGTTRAAKAGKTKSKSKSVQFLHVPACGTCRKARKAMERRGFHLQFRDLWKEPLSAAELEKLIGSQDHTKFLNPRSPVYRQQNMKQEPPSRREAIRLMAREPGLIRRPIILAGGRVILDFDENGRARF